MGLNWLGPLRWALYQLSLKQKGMALSILDRMLET